MEVYQSHRSPFSQPPSGGIHMRMPWTTYHQGLRVMVWLLGLASTGLALTVLALVSLVMVTDAWTQQRTPITSVPAAAAALVFDGVTVVDVVQGKLVPGQQVVIVGTHIQRVGDTKAATWPQGSQVIDARGKYLIPGLWDMHFHHDRN